MLMLQVDKSKPQSAYRQLLDQVTALIDQGILQPGYRMPPSRQLARATGLNRSTVVRVYQELWALGYVESRPGSYTTVRRRMPVIREPVAAGKTTAAGSGTGSAAGSGAGSAAGPEAGSGLDPGRVKPASKIAGYPGETIRLEQLEPDPRLIDRGLFAACARRVIRDPSADYFGYTHPRGYPPLREIIIRHMRLHGIHASDKNILLTNGSQNSLQLIFQSLSHGFQALVHDKQTGGKAVAVESPTYSMAIPLLRTLGLKVVEIPMERDGMDLDALGRCMQSERIGLVYSMPTFHNPTGITMSQPKREALLKTCEKHQAMLIEDSIEEEMKFFGKAHLPVKSMDDKGRVLYLGSFSKVLAPGFRTSWIIGGAETIEKLSAAKTAFDLSSSAASQTVLHHFCASGGYELHIRKMMRTFRKRMRTALDCMKRYIPAGAASWDEPLGGFLIWLSLHTAMPGNGLERHFLDHGVHIKAGHEFYFTPRQSACIRISISKCNESEIEEGIMRVGQAIKKLQTDENKGF